MSTGVHVARSAGRASTTMTSAVTTVTVPGRRMTDWATPYQRASERSDFSRALSLTFHSAKNAGAIRHDAAAATRATPAPPMAIDWRKFSGNSSSVASAMATVSALNTTVRPAEAMVSRTAFGPGPLRSSSSR